MLKTIDDLVKCIVSDTMPPIPVFADYFGLDYVKN